MTEKTTIIEKRGPAIDAAVANFAKGLQDLTAKATPLDKLDEALEPVVKALVDELKAVETAIKKDDIDDGAKDFNSVYRTQAVQQAVSQVMSPMYDLTSALRESIGSIVRDDSVTDKSAKVRESVDQFKDAVMGIVALVEETVGVEKDEDGSDDDDLEMGDDDIEKACALVADEIEKGLAAALDVDDQVTAIKKGNAIAVDRGFLASVASVLKLEPVAKRAAADPDQVDAIGKACSEIMKAAGAIAAAKHDDCSPHADAIHKCAGDIMKACGAIGARTDKDPKGKVAKAASAGDGGNGNGAGAGDNKEGHMADTGAAGGGIDIKKSLEELSASITKSVGEQLAKAGSELADATKAQIATGQAEITKSLADLTERVSKLEGKPQTTGADVKKNDATAVDKSQDGAGASDDDIKKRADAGEPQALMILAQRTPVKAA